jgi:hypothetical protein
MNLGRVQQHCPCQNQRPFSIHENEYKENYDIIRESDNFVEESLFEPTLCRPIGSLKRVKGMVIACCCRDDELVGKLVLDLGLI